jgi:hypothetical protein
MSYELTEEQKILLDAYRCNCERTADGELILSEDDLWRLARSIAEPLAAEVARLERAREQTRLVGRFLFDGLNNADERIAELEAQLARSAKANEPIQDERNTDWD